jgi:hypothetical protein
MHDLDDRLHRLLSSAAPEIAGPDRRPAIRATARRRHVGRRIVAATVAGAVLLGGAVLFVDSRSPSQTVTAGRTDAPAQERRVEVAGLDEPIRASTTRQPLHGYEAFGVIEVGDSTVTGAVQTTKDTGAPVVLVAVTLGPRSGQVIATPSTGKSVTVDAEQDDGFALLDLELERRDPAMTVDLEILDHAGSTIGSVRVAPFLQDPLTCDTNTEIAEAEVPAEQTAMRGGPRGRPTFVPHLRAYLGAPLPAVCDG